MLETLHWTFQQATGIFFCFCFGPLVQTAVFCFVFFLYLLNGNWRTIQLLLNTMINMVHFISCASLNRDTNKPPKNLYSKHNFFFFF